MNDHRTRQIALGAALASLVSLATILHIPVPGFRLYFNLGEGVIYSIALLLGARYGGICGGLGAALADLLLGYPLWAPITLVIKGMEGFVVGKLAPKGRVIALLTGAAVMIAGYSSTAGILYGWKAAPVEMITDITQTGIGAAFALAFVPLLQRRLGRLITGSR